MNAPTNIHLIERVSAVLVEALGDDFDAEAFWDTLDGETDIQEVMFGLIINRVKAQADAKAAKEVASDFNERATRLSARADACTKAMGVLLDATGQRSMPHALATVSRTKGRDQVVIDNGDLVPRNLCVTDVRPDKTAIKEKLSAGVKVPGARLETGPDGVSVRIK